MRFLIVVKASAERDAGAAPGLIARLAEFHDELARAGVLLDSAGLEPSATGWRMRYEGERCRLIDGPFTDAGQLITAYTLIQTRSREEAQAWTRRFPAPSAGDMAAEIEVRPLLDPNDSRTAGNASPQVEFENDFRH